MSKITVSMQIVLFCALVLVADSALNGLDRAGLTSVDALSVLTNPLPLALIWLAFVVRPDGLAAVGLRIGRYWKRAVLIGLGFFVLKILHAVFLEGLYEPIITAVFGGDPSAHGNKYGYLEGDAVATLRMIGLVWLFAAFGEELFFRGLLLTRTERLLGQGTTATLVAVVFSSLVFGLIHWPVGIHQVVSSAIAGVIFYAPAYLLAKRNLIAPMLTHGLWNTFGLTLLYLGMG